MRKRIGLAVLVLAVVAGASLAGSARADSDSNSRRVIHVEDNKGNVA